MFDHDCFAEMRKRPDLERTLEVVAASDVAIDFRAAQVAAALVEARSFPSSMVSFGLGMKQI